jgi:hypothetical protein
VFHGNNEKYSEKFLKPEEYLKIVTERLQQAISSPSDWGRGCGCDATEHFESTSKSKRKGSNHRGGDFVMFDLVQPRTVIVDRGTMKELLKVDEWGSSLFQYLTHFILNIQIDENLQSNSLEISPKLSIDTRLEAT